MYDADFTAPASGAQPIDYLEAGLLAGRAPKLATLLPLEWPSPPSRSFDEQLGPCTDIYGTPRQIAKLRDRDARYESRYPGLITDRCAAEAAKYTSPWPDEDAPLAAHVGRRLLHIRGIWSRKAPWDIRRPHPQFVNYVPQYVGGETSGGIYFCGERQELALQILRLSCGLPRFLPAKAVRK